MIRNELHLASILREELTPKFTEVHANVNLASNRFYPDWEKWHGDPLPSAQPQIDLLMVDSRLGLYAAELKWFRKTRREQANYPFYAGIDEALALLRFGFNVVSLWHLFDENLGKEDIMRLYRSCEDLVGTLNLPINYEAFWLVRYEMQISLFRLSDFGVSDRYSFPSAYGKSNPLHSNIDAQKIQDFLRTVLRIPHPR